jgi:serine/threonine protein kinase
MTALFSAFPSGLHRTRSASEDVDVDFTQVLGEKDSVARAAHGSRRGRSGSATVDTPARLPPVDEPRTIAGYEVLRRLGHGGMGIVYEARRHSINERVALKTIDPASRDAERSLRREIRALKRIDHPGVVRLLAEGTCRGVPFYTMDLLAGPSLATVLAEGTPSFATILCRLASSLGHVHAQGIVHGDLTPVNVLFRALDEPVLIDFGLARRFPVSVRIETGAGRRRIVGTLAYMAPEQIRGDRVDARADLYAFGCILYEALTGRVPFAGYRRATVLRQHLEAAPCPPSLLSPDVPMALERLTLRLLAKSPADRPQCATEVAATLDSLGAVDWNVTRHRRPMTTLAERRRRRSPSAKFSVTYDQR